MLPAEVQAAEVAAEVSTEVPTVEVRATKLKEPEAMTQVGSADDGGGVTDGTESNGGWTNGGWQRRLQYPAAACHMT